MTTTSNATPTHPLSKCSYMYIGSNPVFASSGNASNPDSWLKAWIGTWFMSRIALNLNQDRI